MSEPTEIEAINGLLILPGARPGFFRVAPLESDGPAFAGGRTEAVTAPAPAIGKPLEERVGTDVRTIPWGAKVSPIFRDRICWIADQAKAPVDWFMGCMAFETGRTFSPRVKNPASTATGLIQFMEATARSLGTTTAALAAMTAEQQLIYVYRYFKSVGLIGGSYTPQAIEDVYMAIFMPKFIRSPVSAVIVGPGERAYAVNKGLDVNRDGKITKAEAGAKVRAALAEGREPGNVWTGTVNPT